MITVAIVGGTSLGLGRSVAKAIQQYPDQLKPIVISRETSKAPKWLDEAGIEVRKVNYNDEESLFRALQGVHTVICVLLATDGSGAIIQKNLIHASLRAGVQRFAPAEFGVGTRAVQSIDILAPTLEVMAELRKVKESRPEFEYAGFHAGLFMNYLGYGAPDEAAATHNMNDTWVFIFDVKNMKASIPLTRNGDIPTLTMSEIGDVGRFVAAACLLPKGSWKEDFSLAGDTLRLDEIVKTIERVRGGTMDVSYRSYESIARDLENVTSFYPDKMWLQIELMVAENAEGSGIMPPILNEVCPSVKPLSIEEYMKKFWG